MGHSNKIPFAVGAIGGTKCIDLVSVYQFYSGYRYYHSLHTQIVVDNDGVIMYMDSGCLEHMDDAQQYALMLQVGSRSRIFARVKFVGDIFCPNRYPLDTRFHWSCGTKTRQRTSMMSQIQPVYHIGSVLNTPLEKINVLAVFGGTPDSFLVELLMYTHGLCVGENGLFWYCSLFYIIEIYNNYPSLVVK